MLLGFRNRLSIFFVLSVLDGALVLHVEEKRKGLFGEVLLSKQCIV
jgi:hypothetical protein